MSYKKTLLHYLPKLEKKKRINAQPLSKKNGLIIALFSFVYFLLSMETMASIRL